LSSQVLTKEGLPPLAVFAPRNNPFLLRYCRHLVELKTYLEKDT
jgi:hypothetical protein